MPCHICELPYLEEEIRDILDRFVTRTCPVEFFGAFSEEGCKGHALAMSWFRRKGHGEFCNAMPEICDAIKKYWFDAFGEALPVDLLSPYELLQTYVHCKAKSLLSQ